MHIAQALLFYLPRPPVQQMVAGVHIRLCQTDCLPGLHPLHQARAVLELPYRKIKPASRLQQPAGFTEQVAAHFNSRDVVQYGKTQPAVPCPRAQSGRPIPAAQISEGIMYLEIRCIQRLKPPAGFVKQSLAGIQPEILASAPLLCPFQAERPAAAAQVEPAPACWNIRKRLANAGLDPAPGSRERPGLGFVKGLVQGGQSVGGFWSHKDIIMDESPGIIPGNGET